MKATIRKKNFKDFDSELEIILLFESLESTPIKIYNDTCPTGLLTKTNNTIELEVNNRSIDPSKSNDDRILDIKIGKKRFSIFLYGIKSSSTSVKNNIIAFKNIYSICDITTNKKTNTKCSKFRSFFPVPLREIRTFHDTFQSITYQNKENDFFYDCIRLNINSHIFDVTQFKTKSLGFYVIESFTKDTLVSFREYSFAICQAVGFFTGHMLGGEEYTFSSNLDIYYTNNTRPEIKSFYKPIYTNPYRRLYDKREIAKKYVNKLTYVSSKVLSNLVSEIKSNQNISSCIILILESSSIGSLLLIPSIFAVIIESLSKIILSEEKEKVYPISDAFLAKEIIDELNAVVKKYNSSLSLEASQKIKGRIDNMNSPINKIRLTNREKLIKPFEQLGIKLTKSDILAIEHRNDLLHGNILLLDNEKVKTIEEIDTYMAYISGKLYTLICKLILKHIGYRGYIYNYAKPYEEYLEKKTNEQYFQKV